MKIIRWWILTILAAPAFATESPPEISPARILAHTKILASDEFEGRAPASAGEEKTVNYLISELKKIGLPAVTPHSARHSFISTLQAQGVEVGLVAKLAGHKNAVVTLSHYTHAMRGGEDAVRMLDNAYAG